VTGQYIRLLAVIDGDGKKVALAVGAEQGGGLNGIRPGEFIGFEIDGDLAVVCVRQQAAITPQGSRLRLRHRGTNRAALEFRAHSTHS